MATIRKRKRKRGTVWQAQVRLAGHTPQSATFDTKEEAVGWARKVEGELTRAGVQREGVHTVGEAILRYGQTVEHHRAETTQRGRKGRFRWWYERLGTMALSELRPSHLASARDELAKDRSPATVNRYLAAISAVLTYAADDWGMITTNPARKVRRLPESAGRVRYLTKAEIVTLLDKCREQGADLYLVALMALTTGMRQGELLSMTWEQVDLKRRVIVLPKTKNRERRGIPISGALLDALRAYPRRVDTPLLFPSDGDPSRATWGSFRHRWDQAVEDAKLEDFRFHDLRHTAASHLAMSGATAQEIAQVLGHRTLAMVQRYSHLSPDHVAGVVERLSHEILPPPTPPRTAEASDEA